jgi:hypothetical protein
LGKKVVVTMRSLLAVTLVGLLAITGCVEEEIINPTESWVATDPIQCLGNPWERDWLESHDGDYRSYPRDPVTPGLEPQEEEIIREFYDRLGISIIEIETAQTYDQVCLACSCPQGYTLYLLVPGSNVQAMLDLGYRLELPKR